MINIQVEGWSPWHRLEVLNVDLLGDVEVIPTDNPIGQYKPHVFSRKEAAEKLRYYGPA